MPFSTHLSDDVALRLIQEGDGQGFARAQVKNRLHLAPWNPTRDADFFTTEWQEADVARRLKAFREGTGLPLVLVSANQVVGRVNLAAITRGAFQSAVLSYWIDKDLGGMGTMTLAVRAVLTLAREEFNLHRVQAETLPTNHASQGVLKRLGFKQFGHAPDYLKIDGRWQGHDIFQRILDS